MSVALFSPICTFGTKRHLRLFIVVLYFQPVSKPIIKSLVPSQTLQELPKLLPGFSPSQSGVTFLLDFITIDIIPYP